MALHHLLYRCPRCGHDPLTGERDRASCQACGRAFVRVREGRRIRIAGPDGAVENALIQTLVGDIERLGGCRTAASAPDGSIRYSADVVMMEGLGEDPLYYGGALMGYVERLGTGTEGTLTITGDALCFSTPSAEEITWPLMRINSVQTSSSAVQISPVDAPIVQFRFVSDSPYRWEDLLRSLLREAYRERGRGEIVEFQPRIVCA
jgi:DNA-directed RNA polymerase subunit RPC12/RpoP